MKNYIFVGEIAVMKFQCVRDLKCLGVSLNNELEMIALKGISYFTSIISS